MLGSITLISYHEERRDDLYLQLFHLLGDRLHIRSYAYYQLQPGQSYSDDLVVITAPLVKESILACLDPKTPYIIAQRTVRLDRISHLLDIPLGSHVLVVYNLFAGAVALANDLREMGFDAYHFHPFDNGKPLEQDFEYAITLGEPHLVPPSIPNVINLGMRNLGLSTIGQIIHHFTGSYMVDDIVLNRYIRPYVQTYLNLYNETQRNQRLQRLMESVVAEIEDGALVFDRNNVILLANDKARKILGPSLDDTRFQSLLPEVIDRRGRASYFQTLGTQTYQLVLKPLQVEEGMMMLTIKEVKTFINVGGSQHQYTLPGKTTHTFKDIIFRSQAMGQLLDKARRMAMSQSAVLILGESGTGKELLAQAIHSASPRKDRPFLAVNCGALHASLLESELFGYEEGAFTGAKKQGKPGLFESARGGTLFLDEIGDASLSVQQKLLRVLQEKEILRISGTKTIPVDVRIIVATHQDLPQLIQEGLFRQDLYYRINVLPLQLPPLRQRPEDIELIFFTFLNRLLCSHSTPAPKWSHQALQGLKNFPWPGNIRQLENLAEYLANGIIFDPLFDGEAELHQWLTLNQRNLGPKQGLPDHPPPSPNRLQPESHCLLRALKELAQDQRPPSHHELLAFCAGQGFPLSIHQVKLRLRRLQDLGLACSRRRLGTMISEAGKRYQESSS